MSPSQSARADYFARSARRHANLARESHARGEFDLVVRRTHEAVELWLKGALLRKGIEPAKSHELFLLATSAGQILASQSDLDFLTFERIPAFYGAPDLIPDECYDREDGDRCLAVLTAYGI